MSPDAQVDLFCRNVSVGHGDCRQCMAADQPVVSFSASFGHTAVCLRCLRASLSMLKHYVTEEKRRGRKA